MSILLVSISGVVIKATAEVLVPSLSTMAVSLSWLRPLIVAGSLRLSPLVVSWLSILVVSWLSILVVSWLSPLVVSLSLLAVALVVVLTV